MNSSEQWGTRGNSRGGVWVRFSSHKKKEWLEKNAPFFPHFVMLGDTAQRVVGKASMALAVFSRGPPPGILAMYNGKYPLCLSQLYLGSLLITG